jgi:hypothetical protein
MTKDDDAVEVGPFNRQVGLVHVTCGHNAFLRIVQTILTDATTNELQNVQLDDIRGLIIEEKVAFAARLTSSWWRDRAILLGCGIVAFIICCVFALGLMTLFGWIGWQR